MDGLEGTLELLAFGCNFVCLATTHTHPSQIYPDARALLRLVCRDIYATTCSIETVSDNPISWIDERDDTELGVIADFLETIVDVPVSPRNVIGLIYSRACRCRA